MTTKTPGALKKALLGRLTRYDQFALCLSLEEQFMLVLIRLRLGLLEQFLAYLFNINIKIRFQVAVGPFPAYNSED